MSFNLANRLNNLAATTSNISIELAENYYTKTQTDTEIANLKNKRVVIKNDNDANDPLLVNDSSNANLFTVGKTGNVSATGTISGSGLITTGSTGLQIKDGASTVASLNQAGVLSCQSLLIDSVPYRGYKELAALNMQQSYALVSDGGAVSGWSYTYTGSGGIVKISIYITCYAAVVPQSKSWSLWKTDDAAPSAAGYLYFTTANNHVTTPILMHIDTR